MNSEILKEICTTKMPFGKYKDRILADLPISYLEWFQRNGGFPKGKLGMQLATVYEIKLNGLEDLLKTIRNFEELFLQSFDFISQPCCRDEVKIFRRDFHFFLLFGDYFFYFLRAVLLLLFSRLFQNFFLSVFGIWEIFTSTD